MTIVKAIRPGLWVTELSLGAFDVRGALVVGRERAVVWDTLSHPRDMGPVCPLAGEKPLTAVYSHADWDHVWGTAGLVCHAGTVIGHAACRERFSNDVPKTLREKQAAEPGAWDEVVLIPPTDTFEDALTLDLGDLTLALHHLPGHTPDSVVGLIPEWGVLLAGDAVEAPLPVVNAGSPLEVWIAALREWARDVRARTVVPAHGQIGGRELIRRNVAYLQNLLDGGETDLPAGLDDFYRATHQANLSIASKRSSGGAV